MPREWANLNARNIHYCVRPLLLQGDGSGKELEGGCWRNCTLFPVFINILIGIIVIQFSYFLFPLISSISIPSIPFPFSDSASYKIWVDGSCKVYLESESD